MSEVWKPINGLDGKYEVSSYGRVRSLIPTKKGLRIRILKTSPDNKGYKRLRVTHKQVKRSYKLHRLVAEAFIPNEENKPQVNHIDGDKENNCVSNLEWCTNKENAMHALSEGLWNNCLEASRKTNEARKTAVVAIKGDERIVFESISEAERYFNSRHISDVLNGKRNTVGGYAFEKAGDGNGSI